MTVSAEATTRLVDVLANSPMPEIPPVLNAIVLGRSPGPDGILYDPNDVVSSEMVSIPFVIDNHRMLSGVAISFALKEGAWRDLFLLLMGPGGEPYAIGRIRTADGQPASTHVDAPKNRIEIQYRRTSG